MTSIDSNADNILLDHQSQNVRTLKNTMTA